MSRLLYRLVGDRRWKWADPEVFGEKTTPGMVMMGLITVEEANKRDWIQVKWECPLKQIAAEERGGQDDRV